jgi:hypothetical protein
MRRQTQIIIGVVIVIAAIGGVVYASQSKKPASQNVAVTSESQSTLGQTVEDLLKRSASQEVEPTSKNTNPSATPTPTPSSNSSEPISDACLQQQVQTFGCYEDYYRLLVKTKGVAAAFVDLKQRYDQNGYIKSQCHPITHVIGSTAGVLYGDVGKAYAQGDSVCWSGYYHGVMEGIIGQITSSELAKKMDGICAKIPGKASYSFDYYNCVHGLGHGVMAISQNELFDSLKLCDNISGGWEQSSCWGGAFMENIIVDNKNHFTKYLKPEDPLYPCDAVDDKYKSTCYLMQTSYMLKVTNSDFKKVFELCSTVGNYAATCYQSLGRDASGRSISNVEATKASCNLGKDYDQKSNCIVGAVKDFISYHHSDVQAKQLCAALETEIQSICNTTAESYYKSL